MPQTLTYAVLDVEAQSHFHTVVKFISGTHTIQGGTLFVCDSSGGSFTITLPPAGSWVGRVITVKQISATGTVTVDGDGSETIDGSADFPLATQYDSVTVISDGSNWFIE